MSLTFLFEQGPFQKNVCKTRGKRGKTSNRVSRMHPSYEKRKFRVISSTIDAPLSKTTREWSALWTTCPQDTLPQERGLSPEALGDIGETITLQVNVMIRSVVSLLGTLNQMTTDCEITFLNSSGDEAAKMREYLPCFHGLRLEFRQGLVLRSIEHHRAVHVSLNIVLKSPVLARSVEYDNAGILAFTCGIL